MRNLEKMQSILAKGEVDALLLTSLFLFAKNGAKKK